MRRVVRIELNAVGRVRVRVVGMMRMRRALTQMGVAEMQPSHLLVVVARFVDVSGPGQVAERQQGETAQECAGTSHQFKSKASPAH